MGSKTNDIKYFKNLLPMDVENVIEPFGGSFAVIRTIYNNDKYNKFINDNDPDLFYVYQHPNELIDGIRIWNELHLTYRSKELINIFADKPIQLSIKKYIMDHLICRG